MRPMFLFEESKTRVVSASELEAVDPGLSSLRNINTPEEYEVFYTVKYSVSSGGVELIPPQEIEVRRDYSYDETVALAKQKESAILREALARDLASLVLRRLSAL